jgi:hypothetical protein
MNETEITTRKHIETVQRLVDELVCCLVDKVRLHDQSKLSPPELETFEIYTKKLKGLTYGSKEYRQCLREMKPALDHHYKYNRHHPEHFATGIHGMDLLDIIEMFCDWYAATKRHADGDIRKSIELNKKRFGYGDTLENVFKNTVPVIEQADINTTYKETGMEVA